MEVDIAICNIDISKKEYEFNRGFGSIKKNKSYLIFLKSNKNHRLNLYENEKEKYIRIIIDKILNYYTKL